ncbi:MAG: hypothetical protein ABR907_03305 [Terracidiphilus sp.]|jgi:hypothetical protein
MNKPVVFLRMAAVLTFIHAILHTIGGVFGHADPGPATVAVQAMKINQFLFMGHLRSFWEFYRGLGLGATISLTSESIAFWQLASLAKTNARHLRPILITFAVAYSAPAVNSYTYFFMAPVIVEIMIAVCLGMAIVTAKSHTETLSG